MTKQGVSRCAAVLAVLLGTMGSAGAEDETGIAGIHSWVRVGRKTCLADHFHSGNGNGATRQLAEKQAVQAWADFTAWEYGSSWGHYSLAASKKMNCERTGSWSCFLEARPCRGY
jgi:hypothetical protein